MGTLEVTENHIQQQAYMWIWNQYPQLRGLYFEIHNNAHSARSGMKHKAIGRQPGVADNCLLLPNNQGPVFFEFKTPTGKQSDVQKNWQTIAERQGYKYHIIKSLKQFKEAICKEMENDSRRKLLLDFKAWHDGENGFAPMPLNEEKVNNFLSQYNVSTT